MSNWTEDDHMSPEQERETWARKECARRGIDPDEICADGGITAWMVVDQEMGTAVGTVRRHAAFCRGRDSHAYADYLTTVANAGEQAAQRHLDQVRSVGKSIVDEASS